MCDIHLKGHIFSICVVGIWPWQEESGQQNTAFCCPLLCSLSHRKCVFTCRIFTFRLWSHTAVCTLNPFFPFCQLLLFQLYLIWFFFYAKSPNIFISLRASSLWASCQKPKASSRTWPSVWKEGEEANTVFISLIIQLSFTFILFLGL